MYTTDELDIILQFYLQQIASPQYLRVDMPWIWIIEDAKSLVSQSFASPIFLSHN